MTSLPGHYLGSVVTYDANTPWDLEYSLTLDRDGHYQLFTRDNEGRIRMRHGGTSGRALAEFATQNGFDAPELLRDLRHIDAGFAADFEAFLAQRARR